MVSCYCDYGDGAYPEFITERTIRARKTHRCDECRGRIYPGEQYEYVSGKWDGTFSDFKTCTRCVAFRKWYETNRPCMCWIYGSMFEIVHDDVENDWDTMLKEAPGFLFEVGRRYIAIRNHARLKESPT